MKTAGKQSLLAAALVAGFLSGCGKPAAIPPAPLASVTNLPASAMEADAAFKKLPGKWQRTDGDYTVEIRSVGLGGKLDAGYFNPQPINVAKAEASQDGGIVTVFIELRDVNYPGSTYRLSYDPGKDRLAGTYFQAVAQETYDVLFVRTKP